MAPLASLRRLSAEEPEASTAKIAMARGFCLNFLIRKSSCRMAIFWFSTRARRGCQGAAARSVSRIASLAAPVSGPGRAPAGRPRVGAADLPGVPPPRALRLGGGGGGQRRQQRRRQGCGFGVRDGIVQLLVWPVVFAGIGFGFRRRVLGLRRFRRGWQPGGAGQQDQPGGDFDVGRLDRVAAGECRAGARGAQGKNLRPRRMNAQGNGKGADMVYGVCGGVNGCEILAGDLDDERIGPWLGHAGEGIDGEGEALGEGFWRGFVQNTLVEGDEGEAGAMIELGENFTGVLGG